MIEDNVQNTKKKGVVEKKIKEKMEAIKYF